VDEIPELTAIETQFLTRLCAGSSPQAIASEWAMSIYTSKAITMSLRAKFRAASVNELKELSLRCGFAVKSRPLTELELAGRWPLKRTR
jgi:DNA-binding CsgD family transcriptional regulator